MTQRNRIGGSSKPTKAGQSLRAMSNANVNAAGAGVLRVPGRARDAGRYRDRLREDRKYPNRRRKIITGKELTTPLARKRIIEKARRERAKKAAREAVNIEVKTIAAKTKKFPAEAIFGLFIVSAFLFGLIVSQIVLNEQNCEINDWNDKINSESKKEKNLKNELDNKNDIGFYIDYAVNKLEMVKEESNSIQKKYISGKSGDKAEVVEEKGSSFVDLPDIMSAIFKK